MGVEIRHKVRMSRKELAMLESAGANICHLVVFTRYVEGDERRCLTGPLPKGEEADEMCCCMKVVAVPLRPTD